MADLKKYLTNPELIFEGFFRQVSSYSVFQNKTEFKVKVLTPPTPYAGPDPDIPVGNGEQSPKLWFKGRITDPNMPHEKFLPDPCDESVASNQELAAAIISLHSTVYMDGPADFDVGSIITAFIEPGANNNKYDLQFMRYLKTDFKVPIDTKPAQECITLANIDWNSVPITPVPVPARRDSLLSNNLEAYKIVAEALKDNVLANIRSHESGDNPEIYNVVDGNSLKSSKNLGKPPLTDKTFSQIMQIQQNGGIDNLDYRIEINNISKNPFATGLYQIIPATMKYVLSILPELSNLPYSEDNQHIAAAVLIIDKRPEMGNYLLGYGVDAEAQLSAAQAWAREWAYAPTQIDLKANANGTYPKYDIARGDSYYSGVGGNRSGTSPEEIITALEQGFNALSPKREEIETLLSNQTSATTQASQTELTPVEGEF